MFLDLVITLFLHFYNRVTKLVLVTFELVYMCLLNYRYFDIIFSLV